MLRFIIEMAAKKEARNSEHASENLHFSSMVFHWSVHHVNEIKHERGLDDGQRRKVAHAIECRLVCEVSCSICSLLSPSHLTVDIQDDGTSV